MTFDKAGHEKNEEVEEAEEAKEKADPAVADPQFMPNIVPQTGDNDDSTRPNAQPAQRPRRARRRSRWRRRRPHRRAMARDRFAWTRTCRSFQGTPCRSTRQARGCRANDGQDHRCSRDPVCQCRPGGNGDLRISKIVEEAGSTRSSSSTTVSHSRRVSSLPPCLLAKTPRIKPPVSDVTPSIEWRGERFSTLFGATPLEPVIVVISPVGLAVPLTVSRVSIDRG